MGADRVILHCDLNNFFASVERVLDSTLAGRPLAVCGDPQLRRGIVLAKCEMAKAAGVKTGDTVWMAKSKCPNIQIVTPQHNEYGRFAKLVREIYYRFTDKVESFGIDECWLDVTGSQQLFGDGVTIANELRRLVREELGLTISVGVSWNKTYAKLGSDIKKPDATTVINRENYKTVVWQLPVNEMLMVGRKTTRLLHKLGVKTIGELAHFDIEVLKTHIGIMAKHIIKAARGECHETVDDYHHVDDVKSVGNGATYPRDLVNLKQVNHELYLLAESVASRMRKKGVRGTTINLGIRDKNLRWHGAQDTIQTPTSHARTITNAALKIFDKVGFFPIHSLRVSVSNLTTDRAEQIDLFTIDQSKKQDKLDNLFDELRNKHGKDAVQFGTGLGVD